MLYSEVVGGILLIVTRVIDSLIVESYEGITILCTRFQAFCEADFLFLYQAKRNSCLLMVYTL